MELHSRQPRGTKVRFRPGLLATVAALCIAAAAAHAQYVEDSIDVGAGWVGSLAYNSREDVLYGASEDGVFFAISCDSNRLVESFSLQRALAVDYNSIDNKAYCTFYNTQADDSLLVVDGATHTRIKSLPMDGATIPVWDPASDRVYVSCQSANVVAVVDCASDSLLMYIAVGVGPIGMYINTLRRKLYVQNYDYGTVSIVNMATNQVIKTVDVGGTPNAGYYCRRADKFYSEGAFRECVVIGGQTDTVVARITLPGNVHMMSAAGNEDDGLVYLGASAGSNDYVATVSAQNDSVLVTTVIGREPRGLAYYAPSGLLYCASALTDEVRVLTGDGTQTLATLDVGDYPFVFAVVSRHNRLYIGHLGGTHVYVLRDTSAGIADPQSLRTGFWAVNVTPNPFRQSVAVTWNSSARGGDAARVYAQDGRLVRQARIPAGEARWVWDGRDDSGALIPPGVYVIEAGPGLRAKVVKLK
jgi:YVTN family beta-propeller protein